VTPLTIRASIRMVTRPPIFLSASAASRAADIPLSRFLYGVHSGVVKPIGQTTNGTFLFSPEQVPALRALLNTQPEVMA
jgi:hypothetical protein